MAPTEEPQPLPANAWNTIDELHVVLDAAREKIAIQDREISKLAAFKAYVHQRLDDAGVPVDPESPHKTEGCRIGGRLDIVLKSFATMPSALAAMKSARVVLANLAQADATYEPAWRALTNAILAAEGPMRPEAADIPDFLAAVVYRPVRPRGHLGWLSERLVECSYCRFKTFVGDEQPPFTVICRGCRRNVRVEVPAIHNPDASQNPGAVSAESGRTTNAAETAREGDSCGAE